MRNVLEGSPELVGQEIVVYEPGGLISKEELGFLKKRSDEAPTLTDEQLAEEVVVNINGVHNSLPGNEVVFYLVKVKGQELGLTNDFYQIMSDYQTRFDKNEETQQYERPDTEVTINDFDKEIIETAIDEKKLIELNREVTEVIENIEN